VLVSGFCVSFGPIHCSVERDIVLFYSLEGGVEGDQNEIEVETDIKEVKCEEKTTNTVESDNTHKIEHENICGDDVTNTQNPSKLCFSKRISVEVLVSGFCVSFGPIHCSVERDIVLFSSSFAKLSCRISVSLPK
jgi:hypothetical protein